MSTYEYTHMYSYESFTHMYSYVHILVAHIDTCMCIYMYLYVQRVYAHMSTYEYMTHMSTYEYTHMYSYVHILTT